MTLTGTLTVIGYSMLPWLWLLALLGVVLLVPQVLARIKGYGFGAAWGPGARFMPPLAFVLAIFIIPLHTDSSLAYVNTWVDWLVLMGASLACAIYAWLVFHPLCYLRGCKGQCKV